MAISKQEIFKGITIPNCYIRIDSFSGNKTTLNVELGFYVDVELGSFRTSSYTIDYNVSGGNPLEQAYNYIKGLPEFSGSVDC